MGDEYYKCCDCGRDDVVTAIKSLVSDFWLCRDCYYETDNLVDEIDKAWADRANAEDLHNKQLKEIEQLRAENEYLERLVGVCEEGWVMKIILELSSSAAKKLRQLKAMTGDKTNAAFIRNAIRLYEIWLKKEKDGYKFVIEKGDEQSYLDVFLDQEGE